MDARDLRFEKTGRYAIVAVKLDIIEGRGDAKPAGHGSGLCTAHMRHRSNDHVALAQLWGAMPALPRAIPRFTKDLRQLWDDKGRPPLPTAQAQRHDALVDARHNLARWNVLMGL